jgi:probable phosphoglycerate mutase
VHLLLIRHGQSYVNLDDWTEGYIDAGLTALGKRQAEHLGKWLADNVSLAALYTSTMARTLETAACVEQETGVTAVTDDRLREFGNCYGSGLPVPPEEMPIQYAEFWGTERPFACINEGGESWMLFRVRISSFLDDVMARYGDSGPETVVAVVCHGGVIDAAFDYVFNVGPERRVEIWTHNTGIVHWEYVPESPREKWRLHAHGLVHHLANHAEEWLGSSPILRDASRPAAPLPMPREAEETGD